ncbi:MAG TPA: hypothetical protein PKY88_11250 [Anaerohalosphaeraceae bacterium]|nr:hypothetical protein [Anaerohalosphaeraceae bacterium]
MPNSKDAPWQKIFEDYGIETHDFDVSPFYITAEQIKHSCRGFENTSQKEVRLLCKQDSREDRPECFCRKGLFLLPVENGKYAIIKGEGYVDIPPVDEIQNLYTSQLDFALETSKVGNSEMQHVDYAYASSLIRTFMNDNSLVLTIRGRKYTPPFSFVVNRHTIQVDSVQTEVDAGYEGRDKVVLVEAKSSGANNIIIRQLFFPFRQWQSCTRKPVFTLFFQKEGEFYSLWQFHFRDPIDYNSIELIRSGKFSIISR